MARILVVDDEAAVRTSVATTLRRLGHDVEAAASAEEAEASTRCDPVDVVITDVGMPGASGIDLLQTLRRAAPQTQVVVMTGHGSIEDAVAVMQLGAAHYLLKPFESADLEAAIARALARCESPAEDVTAPEPSNAISGIVGRSRPIRELLALVQRVADTDSTVLVTGETGTGKELIGRAIHDGSRRRGRVFCAANSAAFPETLLESELFGHRRGSFTGATSNKKGLFEHTDGGTMFLDEVAEMPLSMQAKLLRLLQTGEIRPIGSEQTRRVDVRLVTATNKNLETEVEEGRFREDLYYRLAVIPIHIPPLRERVEDVPLLAAHFLRRFAAKVNKPIGEIEPGAMERLRAWSWPGNVRELENCIERCVALCGGSRISVSDLPARVREGRRPSEPQPLESLEVVERLHILNTLDKVGWNRKKAAEVLRISTTTLWRRLREFGIEGNPPRQRGDARMIQG